VFFELDILPYLVLDLDSVSRKLNIRLHKPGIEIGSLADLIK
jgi:hypothetical protein